MSVLTDPIYGEIEYVDESVLEKPALLVVIDTEEEFDWGKPHSRASTGVKAMRDIDRAQQIFDKHRIKPCYVMDYPVVTQKDGVLPLLDIFADGRCEIGAHLHPWVNPPFDEEVTAFNSFPGNLPRELEREKLRILVEEISTVFGGRPIAYKAGRYGIGRNTPQTLHQLGIQTDLSPSPGFNYSAEGGPDFRCYGNIPFRFGSRMEQLCIPCTGGYMGFLGRWDRPVYEFSASPLLAKLRAPGVLAKLRAVERIRLSPEGFEIEELMRFASFLVNKLRCRVMTLSFHSPSVSAGCTPYVTTNSDSRKLTATIDQFLSYFTSELSGQLSSVNELSQRLKYGAKSKNPSAQ